MSEVNAKRRAAGPAPHRVADDITRGTRDLVRMMAEGARAEERFTVRTAQLPPAPNPTPRGASV
jgi:hypothetical protein